MPWFPRPPPGPLSSTHLSHGPIHHLPRLHGGWLNPHERLGVIHKFGLRNRFNRVKKRPLPLYITPVKNSGLSLSDYDDLIDDDDEELPLMLSQNAPGSETTISNVALLDKTPIEVEALHLLRRLLKSSKRLKKRRRKPLVGATRHIIISQGPSEVTTSVQQAVNACAILPKGLSGSPRAATPQSAAAPSPENMPTPISLPTSAPQPVAQPQSVFPSAPVAPRSEIPTGSPISVVPAGGVASAQSQMMMGLGTGSIMIDQVPMMQQSTVALAPVLAEIGALLLGSQPTLSAALGFTTADTINGFRGITPVKFAKPALGMAAATPTTLGMPVASSYSTVVPLTTQSDTQASLTSELRNLMNTLQQQRDLQRQQLEQQQELQREQQNLLPQQRSQLPQQLQQQPSSSTPVIQAVQTPSWDSQQPLQQSQQQQQGRSIIPTNAPHTLPTESDNSLVTEYLQSLLQPGTNTIVPMIPHSVLTVSTPSEDYDDDLPLTYPLRSIRTLRKRKRSLTRKVVRRVKDALMY